MRKLAIMLLLGSSLVLAVSPRIAGTVVSVDSKTGMLVIRTTTGTKRIQVDSQAKVERNGSGSRLGAFHVGETVEVVFSGPFNDDPIHGVEVYDTATAASLPQAAQIEGVYGKPHNTLQTSGGGITGPGPMGSMEGIGQGGASDANMGALMYQQGSVTPTGQQNPFASNPYNPRPQYDPVTGAPYQGVPPNGPQNPNSGQVAAPSSGWSQPAQAPVNNGTGWAQAPPAYNPGPGWSSGQQGVATSFQGYVRNVEMNRNMIFVAPTTGGNSVGVRVGMYTSIQSPGGKPHFGMLKDTDIPPGSTVQVDGQMAGSQFIAKSVVVLK